MNAFREVANSLVTREKLEAIRTEQARAVKVYEEAVQLYYATLHRWQGGYFEVLEAQQQLFPAENTLAQTELNQLLVIVQLYKALGGGWEFKNDPQAATEQDSASSNKETIKH